MIITRRRFTGALVVGAAACAASALPENAFAVTSAEKQAEAEEARQQLDDWQAQLDQASDDYYLALDAHDAAVEKMQEQQAIIDADQARIDKLQEHLSTRARGMYRSGSNSFLEVLLSAESFSDFVNTWDTLNDLNKEDESSVDEVKQLKADAEAAETEYSNQEQIAQQKLDEAETIKANAEATVQQYQDKVATLDAEVAELVAQEQAAAAAAAAQAAAQEAAASGSYSSGSSIPANGSVVDYAYSRLGCPYVWGATGPDTFDCSGLTQWCYAQTGVSIPRTSGEQHDGADAILEVSAAEPGDVLWHSGHVGVCVEAGGGTYIAAPQTGDVVRVQTYPQWVCALRFAH